MMQPPVSLVMRQSNEWTALKAPTPTERTGVAKLAEALIANAVNDVKAWCQRRILANTNNLKQDGATAQKYAIRSMAWLCGIGEQRLPARLCCDALGVDHHWLLETTENEIAKLGTRGRFHLLKSMAIERYGVSGGAA